jgi:DNA-directed RNA polymerase specialized sigma24 family protein
MPFLHSIFKKLNWLKNMAQKHGSLTTWLINIARKQCGKHGRKHGRKHGPQTWPTNMARKYGPQKACKHGSKTWL